MRNKTCLRWVRYVCVLAGVFTLPLTTKVLADQVEMKNGDRYVGQVISMSTDTLVLKNEILGTIKLPRDKVAQLTLGTNAIAPTSRPATNAITATLPAGLPAKAANLARSSATATSPTNVMQQVQQQLLMEASPEAKAKFQELAGGYLTGAVSENQIRVEAQSAAEQLRKFKAELGADAGEDLDGYIAILEGFLNESGSAAATTGQTNRPVQTAQPRR
ncbi:MAG: hypothetical protein QM813_12270 [Verrucomicrobiota bacterium]